MPDNTDPSDEIDLLQFKQKPLQLETDEAPVHIRSSLLDLLHIDIQKSFYISGPMTGLPEYNYPAFEKAAAELRDFGLIIYSPREISYAGEPDENPWQMYMKGGIAQLFQAEGIIMLKGWPKSKGARMELEIALDLGYPVYYYDAFVLMPMQTET